MKVTIAITGSLRDRKSFEQVVEGAFALREACPQVREIRLSSTDDASAVRNATRQWSHRPEFRVICSAPPNIVVKGHRLHQIGQLDAALEGLDSDMWVMKLRTDKLILPAAMLKDCIDRVAADEAAHAGKYGVLEGHIFLPWYVNDMAFFAQAGALREIAVFDVAADIFAPQLATEQVIWARLLGEEANEFFKAACHVPPCHELHPEKLGRRDKEQAFGQMKEILRRYWQVLRARFFSMTDHRFKDPYSLKVGAIDLVSDRIFTRYGDWGASFTEPAVFGEFLRQLDAEN